MAAYAPNDAPTQLSLNTHIQEAWVTSSPTPTTRDYAPCSMLQEMAVLSLVKYGAAKNICLGLKALYSALPPWSHRIFCCGGWQDPENFGMEVQSQKRIGAPWPNLEAKPHSLQCHSRARASCHTATVPQWHEWVSHTCHTCHLPLDSTVAKLNQPLCQATNLDWRYWSGCWIGGTVSVWRCWSGLDWSHVTERAVPIGNGLHPYTFSLQSTGNLVGLKPAPASKAIRVMNQSVRVKGSLTCSFLTKTPSPG